MLQTYEAVWWQHFHGPHTGNPKDTHSCCILAFAKHRPCNSQRPRPWPPQRWSGFGSGRLLQFGLQTKTRRAKMQANIANIPAQNVQTWLTICLALSWQSQKQRRFIQGKELFTQSGAWATLGASTPCTPVGPLAICTYVAAFLHRSRAQADSGCSIGHYRTNMYIVSWGVKFGSPSLVAAFVFRPFTT